MTGQADDRIAAAIASAEARTAAEIVAAILPRADTYRVTALLAAFAVVSLGSVGAALLLPHAVSLYGFIGVTILAIVIYLLCEHTALGIWLTVPAARHRACLTRARLIFLAHGIDATRDRLGLLIFVGVAEHHIEILPDRGIAAVVPASRWADLVTDFTAGIGKAGLEASLTNLIAAVSGELAPHFPPTADQANDLPDRPLRA